MVCHLGQELLYIVCHYHIRSVTWVRNYYIWSVTSFLGVTVGLLAQQGPNILGFFVNPSGDMSPQCEQGAHDASRAREFPY